MNLYVYEHCPYCIKARMIFPIKHCPVELRVLLNDDEATPIKMIGKKMLPILEYEQGKYMPESMDIVRYIDALDGHPQISRAALPYVQAWLKRYNPVISDLLIPRYPQLPLGEFASESARAYFTAKKEASHGSFTALLARSTELRREVQLGLDELEKEWDAIHQARQAELHEDDIHLFAALNGLSVLDLKLPKQLAHYLETLREKSEIPPFPKATS